MSTFKKSQVVMLSTYKEKAALYTNKDKKVFSIEPQSYKDKYNLHIFNDEPIEIGDWVIKFINKEPSFIEQVLKIEENFLYHKHSIGCDRVYNYKKIIASTESLPINSEDTKFKFLAKPTQSFLEKYIIEFNKGKVIYNILINYKKKYIGRNENEHPFDSWICKDILKINPKDNTVTIKKAKENYTRDEVISIIKKIYNNGEKVNMYNLETLIYQNM